MVNLEAIDPLKVDFRVPEIYLRQVQVGQSLQITLDALPGKTYEGKVLAVNPLIDAAGRSIVIRAQVRNQDTTLRPGMFARVRLLTHETQDALVVPEQAIVPQGDEQFVFRVVDGKAAREGRDRPAPRRQGRDRQRRQQGRHGRHRRPAQAARRRAGDDGGAAAVRRRTRPESSAGEGRNQCARPTPRTRRRRAEILTRAEAEVP